MKGTGEIKKMICPFCGKEMFLHRREETIAPRLPRYFSNARSFKRKFVEEFRCNDCVHVFGLGWLNDKRFMQYEFFVFRKGDNRKIWNKILRKYYKDFYVKDGKVVENVDQWNKRIEKMKKEFEEKGVSEDGDAA